MPADRLCAYCDAALRSAEHAPFCSPGCRDRDLLQWLGEGYRVPVAAEEEPALDTDAPDRLGAPFREG